MHQSTGSSANSYLSLIDSGNLANLTSQEPCDKQAYFQDYQKSFKDGEYNLKETVATPFGQSIRSYISGGLGMGFEYKAVNSPVTGIKVNSSPVTNVWTEQPPATTASPLTPQEILKRAQKELQDTDKSFQHYRRNHILSYGERIEGADPFSEEDVIKKLNNEIHALQKLIEESKKYGSSIDAMVAFEALRISIFFKGLIKELKNSSNQSAETRNNEVEKSGSPLEILTEKFKAKGFSYGSLNAYVKLKEYLKELDAGQPIELDGIVYDSKSIEIINTIDDANNRYAQISVFSEDKSVPYHRIIIRGYQKSGSVFTYLDMGQDYERQDNEKKLPKDMEDLKERLEGAAFNDYDNFADVIMTAINKAVSKPTKKASGSLPAKGVSSSLQLKRGGIDLTDRMLNMQIERVGSFALSALVLPEIANVQALDLDKEYARIQEMVSSSIRPSDTRILEFAAACYYRGEFDRRLTQVSSCIKAAHLADELWGRESSEALRLATMLPDALYGG